jgi:hypothetical protein
MKLFDAWNILIASVLVWLGIEVGQPVLLPLIRWIPSAWYDYPVIPGISSVAGVVIFLLFFLPLLVVVWMVRRTIQRGV